MADIKLQFGQEKVFLSWKQSLTSLAENLKKAQLAAARALASEAARRVRQGYNEATFPHSPFTIAVYSQGKSEGAWPKRDVHAGSPMRRTTGLASFVQVRQLSDGFQVEIDPQATFSPPAGEPTDWSGPGYSKAARPVPVALVAQQLENPTPVILQITKRMLAYLYSLRDGTAGHRTGARPLTPSEPTGRTMTVRAEPRPVWRNMRENMHTASDVASAAFDAALRKK